MYQQRQLYRSAAHTVCRFLQAATYFDIMPMNTPGRIISYEWFKAVFQVTALHTGPLAGLNDLVLRPWRKQRYSALAVGPTRHLTTGCLVNQQAL